MTTEIQPTRLTFGEEAPPDPEVVERAKRRRFTAEYRMTILRKADACTQPGQIGALLRRAVCTRRTSTTGGGSAMKPPVAASTSRVAGSQRRRPRSRRLSFARKPVVFLMADLGVTKRHSRPHISNDNPYSESQFKTLKYRPDFPDRFGCIGDGRVFCGDFFDWYNIKHRHGGIGLHTPESVHYGRAIAIREQRAIVLSAAYAAHPERFVRISPQPPLLPTAVWINSPMKEIATSH